MVTVKLYAGIRRAVMVDGLSRQEAAKRFGVHRNTISKMLQFYVPLGYRRRERHHNSQGLMLPFSHKQTGTLLIRHLAHFVSAVDTCNSGF